MGYQIMEATSKLILITGCNKGVGYGMLENLGKNHPEFKFIMAVRSIERGKAAVAELKKTVPNIEERVVIQELDIATTASIDAFVKWGKEKAIKVDCLVNNAGISSKSWDITSPIIKEIFQTNLFGTIEFTDKMLPLIKDSGKIVFVASQLGKFGHLTNEEFKAKMQNPALTKEGLFALFNEYHDSVAGKKCKPEEVIFAKSPYPVYSLSKLFLNVYTKIFAQYPTILARNIQVYSCCPGWTKTDLGGPSAILTIPEGAICPCFVVNLPWVVDKAIQGSFYAQCKVTPLQSD
eukprot:TRINITY_DN265_c0_g1_i1.p1 TRINITY_DN265_c0_g1~~TRINITY_DN265_c0_g1_i1.p1  ORF type:complete len:324 (+),score=65.04 TRINITY_DN265_c0_g1_i1:99-974(+)